MSVLALLAANAAPAQTPKPAPTPARPAQPAPRQPAVQTAKPAAPKPANPPAAPAMPEPPPPDATVHVRYVTGDKTTTSTVALKDARQRIDYGGELAVLQDCGTGRVVQMSDANQKYLVAVDSNQTAAATPVPGKIDGVVTYTTTVTDTGERKEMFGGTARRIQTVLTKEATPKACDKGKERVETDGWYIDPPAGGRCTSAARPAPAQANADCRDEIRSVGDDIAAIGYPVAYTMTTTIGDGKPSTMTMTMEVTELVRSTLPAAQFAVPDGYLEVKTLEALTRPVVAGPKKAGVLRVGVAPIRNAANGDLSERDLFDALVVSLGEADVDAVALTGTQPAELAADARANDADFILTTDVAEVKQGSGGRVLGKLSGASRDSFSAKVDFKLLPAAGTGAARLSASERSGTSTLKMAIGAARTVSRYMTPFGLMGSRFNFMGTFSDLSNGTSSGTMQQSPDPVLNTVFSLADRATGGPPETDLLSADAAVASALEREVKAVASELQKKR